MMQFPRPCALGGEELGDLLLVHVCAHAVRLDVLADALLQRLAHHVPGRGCALTEVATMF